MNLNGRLKRLEESSGISPEDEAKRREYEKRRAEIRAELEAFEARRRTMTEEERKAALEWLKAWRTSPEGQAENRALEAELARRRKASGDGPGRR
jgi:vacuolar-type H+-ATPase subunit I/STV1